MIEVLCIVVGAVIGFITGALVYRNNADEWKEKSEVIEARFDAEVANASKEIARLQEELKAALAKKTKSKK